MDKRHLPTEFVIGEDVCKFNSDYRDILDIFKILNEPNLLEQERLFIALTWFYKDDTYKDHIEEATKLMLEFLNGGDEVISEPTASHRSLYDWEQDFEIIIAPVNKVLSYDARGVEYLHWWTFLSAFMEIGECTFNTYVGIRDKLNRNIRLEKWEEKVYRDNKSKIDLKTRYDDTTQSILDEIMGV